MSSLELAWQLEALVRIDGECRRILAIERVAEVRLGQIGRQLKKHILPLGFSRFTDYCNDRLGLCSATVNRAIRLVDALDRFAHLKQAFLQGRIHAEKALQFAPHLAGHPDQEEVLVEQASRLTVRALRELLKDQTEDLIKRTYHLTPTESKWVQDAIELCSAMGGSQLSPSEAWELIVADFLGGVQAPQVTVYDVRRRRNKQVEEALERTWREWDFLGLRLQPVELLERELPREALALQQEALALLETQRCTQLVLGQLLVEMEGTLLPCFANISHYGKECLGLSGSQTRALALRERRLRTRPALQQSLRDGRITVSKVDILWPAFERGLHTEPWVEFAGKTSCKVLTRWVKHLMGLEKHLFETWVDQAPTHAKPAHCAPAWLRLIRLPGTIPALAGTDPVAWANAQLVEVLTCQMFFCPAEELIPFRVHLTLDVLRNVLAAEAAVEQAAGGEFGHVAAALALTFTYAHQDKHQLKGRQKRLLFRDEFTCSAPGCTAKCKLHAHHVVFRSQGGDNGDENQIVLCMACHLKLVHQGYLIVKGTASDLIFERVGERWRNEMLVAA